GPAADDERLRVAAQGLVAGVGDHGDRADQADADLHREHRQLGHPGHPLRGAVSGAVAAAVAAGRLAGDAVEGGDGMSVILSVSEGSVWAGGAPNPPLRAARPHRSLATLGMTEER